MRLRPDSLASGNDGFTKFVSPEEEQKYSQAGVDAANDQFVAIEMDKARLAGAPISRDEAIRRVKLQNVGYQTVPTTGEALLPQQVAPGSGTAAQANLRFATQQDVVDHIEQNYPTITAAARSSGLSESEILTHVNFATAVDAATAIATSPNPRRQAQIYNSMGPDMQGVVGTILNAWWEDSQTKAGVASDNSTGNAVTDTASTVWSYTGSPFFDALWAANQLAVRAVTATVLSGGGTNMSLPDAWAATAPNQYDPQGIEFARQTYGSKTVDVIIEARAAAASGDDDAIGQLYKKYAETDPEAAAILDAALFGVNADQNLQDAVTYVTSLETGNLGNIIFWSMYGMTGQGDSPADYAKAAQSSWYTGVRDTTNISATIFLDPTLIGGKAVRGYQAARYGLRLLSPGKIDTAFTNPNVRRFFDTLGDGFRKYDEAADLGQKAQVMNSIRSQYKSWFTPAALDELRAAGVYTADDALEYFRGAENVRLITTGQAARRGKQIVIPHMIRATALAKRASLVARGLTYDRNAGARIDEIFGPGVSAMLPQDAIPVVINKLSETDGDQFVGRMLSDFVFADGAAKRTFIGRILGFRNETPKYGYKRQGGARARIERTSRLMAHMPDIGDGLWLTDGRDAQKVRDLMLFAGMPKYWADAAADLWRNMDTGQRLRFASGMGRSAGYALGVDIVDPVSGKRLIDDLVMGLRQGELYAPDQQDLVGLRGKANGIVNGRLRMAALSDPAAASLQGAAPGTTAKTADGITLVVKKSGAVDIKRDKAFRSMLRDGAITEMQQMKQTAPWTNPSRAIDETTGGTNGLYAVQMTDRISMPNLAKLESLSMRQSYLTALLGLNEFATSAVDVWTLATLAGPRFQLRNGLEDAGLYALTGGNWKGYRAGRLYSTAKREATQRPRRELTDTARGEKLGIVKSTSRWLGDQMPKALQGLIWPHLDAAEIAAANGLAARGDRSALVALINKAMLRGLAKYTRGRVLDAETVRYLDEAGEFSAFSHAMDDVSETARHLSDGIAPGVSEVEEVVINGTPMRVITADKTYSTLKVKRGDPRAVKDWWANLSIVLHGDRGKGQAAVARIRAYHAAKLKGDQAKVQEIVDDFAEWIIDRAPWVSERSGLAATEGVESFARKNLDDVLRLFTSKSGGFNNELYDMIRRVDVDPVTGDEMVTFALWDDGPAGPEFRVFEQDLAEMKARPQTVLDMEGLRVPVVPKAPLDQRLWAAMGRSLARMTREPIFVSNYLDSRKALAPFEARIADQLGGEVAKRWAVEAAYERAYGLSVAYIDNPSVRSQMAWSVRNVARFYRAQEDFFRRIVRVTKLQPEAFQRLHLTWRVLDETGFVWTDEYGDKYFIWPGSRMMMQAVNKLTSVMGLPVAEAGLPMVFASRVTMTTPSADPNSWWPTMSSPYASLGLRPLMQIVPGLSSLEQEMFGEYSTGKPIWESILPPNLLRPLEYFGAQLAGQDARGVFSTGSYASTARSAVQAYAAAGIFSKFEDPANPPSVADIAKMKQAIDTTALDIMFLKMVLSPAALASFTVQPDTVTDFARSIGVDGMREAFVQLLKANGGDQDAALVQWVSTNPGRSIFTVTQNTNGEYIGNYGPFRETVQWIETNQDVVEKYPVGAAFFAPQDGTQNLAAWSYLRAMGAKVPKSVDAYFNEVATAQGYALYRIYKTQYDQAVAEGRKAEVQPKWDAAKADLNSRFPLLDARINGTMATTDWPSAGEYERDMNDYRGAISMMKAKGELDDRGFYAEQVVNMYDEARNRRAEITDSDPLKTQHLNQLRDSWLRMIADMKNRFPGDRQWESLLYTASGALGYKVAL